MCGGAPAAARTPRPASDAARPRPAGAIGAALGLAAFAPLLAALVPVLRRKRDADMGIGLIGVFVSFAILLVGVVVVAVVARAALVAFTVGELAGFFVGLIAVACMVIWDHGR